MVGRVSARNIRSGNKHLKTVLCQGVLSMLRSKNKNYLQALYHRVKGRREWTAVSMEAATAMTALRPRRARRVGGAGSGRPVRDGYPVRARSPESAVIRGNRDSEGPLECPSALGEILEKPPGLSMLL